METKLVQTDMFSTAAELEQELRNAYAQQDHWERRIYQCDPLAPAAWAQAARDVERLRTALGLTGPYYLSR